MTKLWTGAMIAAVILTMGMETAGAQTGKTNYQFDFGPGQAAPGHIQILPTTAYTPERGYGFEPGSVGAAGSQPRLFSVALPEGNYNVTVTLGDAHAPSSNTIKAEARRLMLEKIETAPGQFITRTFTVNIRTPQIQGGGHVKLKGREAGPPLDLDWDDKLTLEFNGADPHVQSVRVAPAPEAAVTVFILGDSTVTDQPEEPWCAWGQMLPRFFQPGVAVANHAESGESLRSSMGANRLAKVWSAMKPGDYLFIQYGHNDQKEHGVGVGAFTTYQADLEHWVAETRRRGGLPVLVTSMNRRRFDADGKIINTLGDYPEAVHRVARAQNAPLIDLNAASKTLFEAMGPEGTLKAFVHYPAGTFPGQTTALRDDTHFNAYGAYELAKCVVEGIRADHLGLTQFLTSDTPPFDPAHPDPVDLWNLPASPSVSVVKPYGN